MVGEIRETIAVTLVGASDVIPISQNVRSEASGEKKKKIVGRRLSP